MEWSMNYNIEIQVIRGRKYQNQNSVHRRFMSTMVDMRLLSAGLIWGSLVSKCIIVYVS